VSDEEGRWQLSLVEKVVGGAMLALLGWMAFTVQQVSVDVAVLKDQAERGNQDRFTMQDGQRLTDRLDRAEARIQQLEEGAHSR